MPTKKKEEKQKGKRIATVKLARTTRGLKITLDRSEVMMDWLKNKCSLSKTREGFNRDLQLEYYCLPKKGVLGAIREEIVYNGQINPAVMRIKEDSIVIPNVAVTVEEMKKLLNDLTKTLKTLFTEYIKPISAEAIISICDSSDEEVEEVITG